jgi:hypothetical protein
VGQVDRIKFTKNVLWLKPFVRAARHKIPLKKIGTIMGYQVRKGSHEQTYGRTTTYHETWKVGISILIHSRDTGKLRPCRCETIIFTLAHELAHIVHWEHTPEHFKLQGELIILFYDILKKSGIKDYMTRHPQAYFQETK